jgi:hypothetical protein
MAEEKDKEKKLIIDEDWKNQAQKEKETLAEQEKQEKAEKQKSRKKSPHGPLPKGDFAALISLLVTQAFFALGALKIEGQEDKEPDLELAKYNIDMLETLQEKTKGNLIASEQKVLDESLHQLRMVFVQMTE